MAQELVKSNLDLKAGHLVQNQLWTGVLPFD